MLEMTYEELKRIAQPHIRINGGLPSNSFLLLAQLHIPFKTEEQCEMDFKSSMNPLYNCPAFLTKDKNANYVIYFNSNAQYWNFYIFHEISHYLLGHECDSPQNEIDADMLACILAAPTENLPSYLKSARDLSSLCKIPIDKAEMYWQEIKQEFSNRNKKIWIIGGITCIITSSIVLSLCLKNHFSAVEKIEKPNITTTVPLDNNQDDLFYVSSSGTHYHTSDCQYIKYKTNIIPVSLSEIEKLNLEPCEDCIE